VATISPSWNSAAVIVAFVMAMFTVPRRQDYAHGREQGDFLGTELD
jgi:hypothetical protein